MVTSVLKSPQDRQYAFTWARNSGYAGNACCGYRRQREILQEMGQFTWTSLFTRPEIRRARHNLEMEISAMDTATVQSARHPDEKTIIASEDLTTSQGQSGSIHIFAAALRQGNRSVFRWFVMPTGWRTFGNRFFTRTAAVIALAGDRKMGKWTIFITPETGQALTWSYRDRAQVVNQHRLFSPDGKTIATGSDDDNIVRLWDAQTAANRFGRFPATRDRVTHIAFSPDSSWLVSGADDNTMRRWDSTSGWEAARNARTRR